MDTVSERSKYVLSIKPSYIDFLNEQYPNGFEHGIFLNYISDPISWFDVKNRMLNITYQFYNGPVNIYDTTRFKNPGDFIDHKDQILDALIALKKAYTEFTSSKSEFVTITEELFISSQVVSYLEKRSNVGKFVSEDGFAIKYGIGLTAGYDRKSQTLTINQGFCGERRRLTDHFDGLEDYVADKEWIRKALKELRKSYEDLHFSGWTRI